MIRSLLLSITVTVLLAACATAIPRHTEASCAAARLPENLRFGAWNVDKFAGLYRNADAALTVQRVGEHRLVVTRRGEARDLTTDNIEGWLFRDGCGSQYQFVLPSDGPGAWLTITDPGAVKSEWQRR